MVVSLTHSASLRVNPEPFGCAQAIELIESQIEAFKSESRRVDRVEKLVLNLFI